MNIDMDTRVYGWIAWWDAAMPAIREAGERTGKWSEFTAAAWPFLPHYYEHGDATMIRDAALRILGDDLDIEI